MEGWRGGWGSVWGVGCRPLSLPASLASVLAVCSSSSFHFGPVSSFLPALPPRPSRAPSISSSPSFFFSAFSILSMAFHFNRLHSFQQLPAPFFFLHSPRLFPPPVSAFPLFFPQSIFASLLKPRPPFHPSILSSIHPYSTSRWIENKVLKQLSR